MKKGHPNDLGDRFVSPMIQKQMKLQNQGEDKLTTALADLLECSGMKQLPVSEQLGCLILATYLRSTEWPWPVFLIRIFVSVVRCFPFFASRVV